MAGTTQAPIATADPMTVAYIAGFASLAAAIVAFVGVLIGAWMNARFNRRLEELRAGFARDLEAVKDYNAAVAVSRGLRHNTYARYLAAVNAINKLPPVSQDGPEILEWGNAFTALELVAPPETFDLVRAWGHTISDQLFNKGAATTTTAWGDLRKAVLRAMRDDLERRSDPE